MEQTLTASSQPDKELGGFMGVVTCKLDGVKIWKDCTGITRLNRKEALNDAKKMIQDLKLTNQF